MTTFTLPISPNYVAHWGLWEAVREFIQNAYDQKARDPSCVVDISTTDDGDMIIETSTGKLSKGSLLLGASEGATRGQFGEGYKLAMLVLCRLCKGVRILTDMERWTPAICRDEQFDADVLKVFVEPWMTEKDGVRVEISNVDWNAVKDNFLPYDESDDRVLESSKEKGRIYVGGLYVATVKGLAYGYALKPSTMKLDRDRSMIRDFDLDMVTSRIWAARNEPDKVSRLLEDNSREVNYIHYSPVVSAKRVAEAFVEKHGSDVVPVVDQAEIEKAVAAGVKWRLVPQVLRNVLSSFVSYFIPSRKTPLQRLKDLYKECKWSLNDSDRNELADIIKTMEQS